jgi:hypothetical protein
VNNKELAMFINFTARKTNGDFYVTSSEVEMEKYPQLTEFDISLYMMGLAQEYFTKGWNVQLTQEVL